MSLVGVGIFHGCLKTLIDLSYSTLHRRNNWKLAFPGVTAEIIQGGSCLQFSPSVSLGQRSGKISGAWMRTFAGLEANFSSWIMLELNEALKFTRRQDKDFEKLRLIQKVVQPFFIKHLDQHVQSLQNTRPISVSSPGSRKTCILKSASALLLVILLWGIPQAQAIYYSSILTQASSRLWLLTQLKSLMCLPKYQALWNTKTSRRLPLDRPPQKCENGARQLVLCRLLRRLEGLFLNSSASIPASWLGGR